MSSASRRLNEIADRLTLIASVEVTKRALERLRTPLAAELRNTISGRFVRRTGLLRASADTVTTQIGIAARIQRRAFYGRIHEGGPRPFVRPVVESFAARGAAEIAREIEAEASTL